MTQTRNTEIGDHQAVDIEPDTYISPLSKRMSAKRYFSSCCFVRLVEKVTQYGHFVFASRLTQTRNIKIGDHQAVDVEPGTYIFQLSKWTNPYMHFGSCCFVVLLEKVRRYGYFAFASWLTRMRNTGVGDKQLDDVQPSTYISQPSKRTSV